MPAEKKDRFGRETRPRLRSYMRQYIFGMDADGERYVWINAVSRVNSDIDLGRLKKGIVAVRDGGNSFWKVLLNINDGKVVWTMINGGA